jgi:hypothetical protein
MPSFIGGSFTNLPLTAGIPRGRIAVVGSVCWRVPMTCLLWQRATRRLPGLALSLAIAVPAACGPVRASDVLPVVLDQAQIVKLPDHLATIVVGNPLIADVSVQPGGVLVVTGKGYGTTNLIALDRAGRVVMDQLVQVQSPIDSVVVYRGVSRESYSCSPFCERRITLGDTQEYFDITLNQTGNRNTRAQTGTGQTAPPR